MRYAVFAFSSRHLNRQDGSDGTEALQHHNCCVQLLIPALSEPREHINEDILATVAILRQHEEMDGMQTDSRELIGTDTLQGRIINSISPARHIS